jgi:Flp pilus assembly protein TadD
MAVFGKANEAGRLAGVRVKTWAALLIAFGLAACAGPQGPAPFTDALFHDSQFGPPTEKVGTADVFALSDEMRRFISENLAYRFTANDARILDRLVTALNAKGKLHLEYDASVTRNAAEAFHARAGNCLSLVIMTAAFARALDIQVDYQTVDTDAFWSRHGNLLLASGHVNATLTSPAMDGWWHAQPKTIVIDFVPASDVEGLGTHSISDQTLLAMYMNNRAAEALVRNELDNAYAWARGAILEDARFAGSYNTLGVIYERKKQWTDAEAVLRYALRVAPRDTRSMSNLADSLDQLGGKEEAKHLRERIAAIEPFPPYYFFDLGMAAMNKGDYRSARNYFAKEVARADYNNEFHSWLAVAEFKLGDLDHSREQMAIAIERSTDPEARQRYSGKLAMLRAAAARARGDGKVEVPADAVTVQ